MLIYSAWRRFLCRSLRLSFPSFLIPLNVLIPLSPAWPELLKLPASSCCYEPRGFCAALWGRSHALPKRKKGRKTAITISQWQKKWEQHAWLCLHVSSQHLHAQFCAFNTGHLGKMHLPSASLAGYFVCFLDKSFHLFFQGGGVAELVRKLETEPPTVEVSQPSI